MRSFIVAGEYRHACLVAGWLGLTKREWVWLHEVSQLWGTRGATVYVYDTITWRKDYAEITDELILRDCNVIPITEGFDMGLDWSRES